MLWLLGGCAYLAVGALLGRLIWKEWRDDTPTEELSFWRRVKRMAFFPFTVLDVGWKRRGDDYPVEGLTADQYACVSVLLWPLLRLVSTLIFLAWLLVAVPATTLVKAVVRAMSFAIALVPGGSSETREFPFSADKEKLLKLHGSISAKAKQLAELISEGNKLEGELGANGAAKRCRALVNDLQASLERIRAEEKKVRGALDSVEEEEKNFGNLSRLLGYYRKVAKAKAGASVNIAEVETAMADALTSCEKVLEEMSSEEIDLMGTDTPVEVLAGQVKDVSEERARLREKQEQALAASVG